MATTAGTIKLVIWALIIAGSVASICATCVYLFGAKGQSPELTATLLTGLLGIATTCIGAIASILAQTHSQSADSKSTITATVETTAPVGEKPDASP